ncbi:MAG: LLM class flavin-dependent oxidoreductase, partial [Actinomycetes bacterium]
MQIRFGAGISTAVGAAGQTLALATQADRDGLDLFSVSDHPYVGDRLDAYSLVGVALGATTRIAGLVNV